MAIIGIDLGTSNSAAAVLGTQFRVPTLNGTLEVTVPPGLQPGAVLRLRGKGLPRYGGRGRGDINLRIEVQVPERTTAEERELYERLRTLARRGNRERRHS